MARNLIKIKEIKIGDLVKTFDEKIGIVTDISNRGICLSTIEDDIKIYCKDIKAIRFFPPKCLRHHKRNCNICNQKNLYSCERCGKSGASAVIDPYDLEVNDKIEKCFLCDECYQERADAI